MNRAIAELNSSAVHGLRFPIKGHLPTSHCFPFTYNFLIAKAFHSHHHHLPRRNSPLSPPYSASATMGSYYYTGCEQDYQPHFLDCCSLCNRQILQNSDIFMYRGNTPFCSQECRQEQIEMDEAMEKKWRLSSSSKRSKSVRQTSDSTKESDTNKAVRTGAVAVS